jgi:hypothetical protein
MKNQVLSIKQMKHLQDLGVDISKASCYWWYAEGKNYLYWGKCSDINGIPTFTLQDMLEMMPDMIEKNNILFFLLLKKQYGHYMCSYVNMIKFEELWFIASENILTCAYETLCWLAEKGLLKGGNNENK